MNFALDHLNDGDYVELTARGTLKRTRWGTFLLTDDPGSSAIELTEERNSPLLSMTTNIKVLPKPFVFPQKRDALIKDDFGNRWFRTPDRIWVRVGDIALYTEDQLRHLQPLTIIFGGVDE